MLCTEQSKALTGLLMPVQIGGLFLQGNLFLAPVAGYSDKAFRSICVDMGADFTYTEMVSSEALVRSSLKTAKLIERTENEKNYAVQLFGSNPSTMAEACKLIIEKYNPECIDINAGCPMQKINKSGAGAVLTGNPHTLFAVTKATVKAAECVNTPVTVKIRSGWSNEKLTWSEAATAAIEAGAKAITIHPRTRQQCYSGNADWNLIARLVELARPHNIPVFGSGDLFTPKDAKAMLEQTGCAGIMFARGAMGNPFIFRQTKQYLSTGEYEKISISKKLQTGLKELTLLCSDLGEERGCLEMRKRFAAYTKGIENGGKLRALLVKANTIGEYKEILSGYI